MGRESGNGDYSRRRKRLFCECAETAIAAGNGHALPGALPVAVSTSLISRNLARWRLPLFWTERPKGSRTLANQVVSRLSVPERRAQERASLASVPTSSSPNHHIDRMKRASRYVTPRWNP